MPVMPPNVITLPIGPLAQPCASRNTPMKGPIPACMSAMKKLSASSGRMALAASSFWDSVTWRSVARRWRSLWLTPTPVLWFALPWMQPAPALLLGLHCGLLAGDDGTSCIGGRGLAGRATPGNGRISTGGGSGSTCWLATGGTACGGGGGVDLGGAGGGGGGGGGGG